MSNMGQNAHPVQHRQFEPYTPEEAIRIQTHLAAKIPSECMSTRPGGSGQGPVSYLEGWRAFNYANEIFGFNGWSSEILEMTVDFMDNDAGKYSCGIACTVRVYLKDGTFHDVS